MMDWHKFWTDYPATAGETDFLIQTGHTVGGVPYSEAEFGAMLGSIRLGLDLGAIDDLLDLCCGNGVVTHCLVEHCRLAVGVDFSETLFDIARRHHAHAKIRYLLGDVRALCELDLAPPDHFSRILMYAALQHLHVADLARLLDAILAKATRDAVIFIGGILDTRRKTAFLDTPEKRQAYEEYRRTGRDRLGTWWHPQHIAEAADRAGLRCEIDDQSAGRPGAHYRFDARLTQ